jgi:hypothetical protein
MRARSQCTITPCPSSVSFPRSRVDSPRLEGPQNAHAQLESIRAVIVYGLGTALSLSNMVPRLEISIHQHAENACRIHHRGRTERVMGEP